jgi:large subunit ribosomal protein L6e
MAPSATKKKATKGKKVAKTIKNRDLGNGIARWSRFKIRQKNSYRLKKVKATKVDKKAKKTAPKVTVTVIKQIGGAKNGSTRVVRVKKNRASYATKAKVTKRPSRNYFAKHTRHTRRTLVPGKVLILLGGRHKGKRVVLLKVLKSGLLLVNGPFYLNSCPMRRISQRYVICTKTRVNLKGVTIPEHINDEYFKRASKKKARKTEGDIFAKEEEKYAPSEQRKKDQIDVDKLVRGAIKKTNQGLLVSKYLKSNFALKSHQYPHRLRF